MCYSMIPWTSILCYFDEKPGKEVTVEIKAVSGLLTVTAKLNFQLLVKPVADFLGVPEEESRVFEINKQQLQYALDAAEAELKLAALEMDVLLHQQGSIG